MFRSRSSRGRVRTPWAQRLQDLRRGPLTLIVWLAAVGGAGWLLSERTRPAEFVALAYAPEITVASLVDGRLTTLGVERYERVEAGEVIARFDDRELHAGLEVARARGRRAAAELVAVAARLTREEELAGIDRAAELRRFLVDEMQARAEVIDLRAELATDGIEAERLAIRARRLEEMVGESIASIADLDDARLRRDEVQTRLNKGEERLAVRVEALAAATARREALAVAPAGLGDVPAELMVLEEELRVQELRVVELDTARRHLMLRAPIAGRVARVEARPGEAVRAGEAVVALVPERATEIVAYVPSDAMAGIAPACSVSIGRPYAPRSRTEAEVMRVSPQVELLPERLWRDPAVPEYGRGVLIAASGAGFVPGERLTVSIRRETE